MHLILLFATVRKCIAPATLNYIMYNISDFLLVAAKIKCTRAVPSYILFLAGTSKQSEIHYMKKMRQTLHQYLTVIIFFQTFKTSLHISGKSWGAEILRECSPATTCHMPCVRGKVSSLKKNLNLPSSEYWHKFWPLVVLSMQNDSDISETEFACAK